MEGERDGKGGEGERRGREGEGREGDLCSFNMSFKKPCDTFPAVCVTTHKPGWGRHLFLVTV